MEITIVGNLVRDPEVRETKFGPVAKLRVAYNETKIKDGEVKDGPSTFIDVSAWRRLAEAVKPLSKGDRLFIVGKLKGRDFERQDGTKGYAYEIEADHIGVPLASTQGATSEPAVSAASLEEPAESVWDD